MRNLAAFSLLASAIACGGSTSSPPEGPLKLGIVSGNNQIAPAGSTQLIDPVVGRLVRVSTASGPRFEFVKTAYAQTVVTGSPVPGAVVCAVSVTPNSMVPFVPCTNTAADGTATFFFTPGTLAGVVKSEIRGTLAGQPAVFDTAKATVKPAAPAEIRLIQLVVNGSVTTRSVPAGGTLDLHPLIAYVRDQYQNLVAPATAAEVSDQGLSQSTTSITPQWGVRDGTETTALAPDGTGWIATFAATMAGKRVTLYVWAGVAQSSISIDVK